jgi:hypothetical protein
MTYLTYLTHFKLDITSYSYLCPDRKRGQIEPLCSYILSKISRINIKTEMPHLINALNPEEAHLPVPFTTPMGITFNTEILSEIDLIGILLPFSFLLTYAYSYDLSFHLFTLL